MEKVYNTEDIGNESYMMYDCTFKKMKDLRVGDCLMGEDCQPCYIQSITQVTEPNYLVVPVKGEPYIIGESHSLAVSLSGERFVCNSRNNTVYTANYIDLSSFKRKSKVFNPQKYGNSKEKAYEATEKFLDDLNIPKTLRLSYTDYDNSSKDFKHCTKIYRVKLEFPEQGLPIDPYILGVWLGDGHQNNTTITSIDKEIIDYFRDYFESFGLEINQYKCLISYGVVSTENHKKGCNFFRTFLQNYGLHERKYIPDIFLRNSRENRLKLLAGLLDTDGSLDNNCYDFVQKRGELLDQVIFLCRSLGFSCYKVECEKTCTNASGGPKTGIYYRCCISGEGIEQIPCLLERKKAKPREQVKDVLVTGMQLKPIGTFPNYRLVTSSPRYLMSDFTVRQSYAPQLKLQITK